MNKTQRAVVSLGAVVIVLMAVVPPWHYTRTTDAFRKDNPAGYAPIFAPPPQPLNQWGRRERVYSVEVDLIRLVIQCAATALLVGVGFLLLAGRGGPRPGASRERSPEHRGPVGRPHQDARTSAPQPRVTVIDLDAKLGPPLAPAAEAPIEVPPASLLPSDSRTPGLREEMTRGRVLWCGGAVLLVAFAGLLNSRWPNSSGTNVVLVISSLNLYAAFWPILKRLLLIYDRLLNTPIRLPRWRRAGRG